MVPVDIVQIDIKQGSRPFSAIPAGSYRPAGTVDQYRDVTVNSLKHPGMTIHLMYRDPMSNYLRSLMTTAPLTIAVAFIVLLIFLAVRWQRRQLSGQNCWKHAPCGY